MDIDIINSRNLKLPNKGTDAIYDSEHDAVLTKHFCKSSAESSRKRTRSNYITKGKMGINETINH